MMSPAIGTPYGPPSSMNIMGGPSPAGGVYPATPATAPMTPMTPASQEGSGITPQLQ